MAKIYFEKLSSLIKKLNIKNQKNILLVIKHFFSGAAVYANGKICITLTPKGLAIKLPEIVRIKLLKDKEAKPLRYFPNSPIKKEYVLLKESKIIDLKKIKN